MPGPSLPSLVIKVTVKMEQNKHDVADHLEDDFSDNESITSTSENNEESHERDYL